MPKPKHNRLTLTKEETNKLKQQAKEQGKSVATVLREYVAKKLGLVE